MVSWAVCLAREGGLELGVELSSRMSAFEIIGHYGCAR